MPSEITIRTYLENAILVREQLPEVIIDAMMDNRDKIVSMNQEQLYDGKNIKGEDIRPLYTEDSFFKTDAQAKGYIKWKQKITPNSKRNPNAPNLFINGYYHRSIELARNGLKVFLRSVSAGALGSELSTKYPDTLGLTPENQEKANSLILPYVMSFVKKYL